MNSAVLSLRVSSKLKEKLEALVQATQRTKSYVAEKALEQYLEANSWQIMELKKAEEEIKKEKLIPQKEVESFLDTW